MQRGPSGRYQTTTTGGERVAAFVPSALPPAPAVHLGGALSRELEAAAAAVARLDGVAAILPNREIILYSYVRREAVLSSQIEGTQSSLSDLLVHELGAAPGVPVDDAVEVSCHVAALHEGLGLLRAGTPLSNRLIWAVHRVLLGHGRGSGLLPGEFRRSQNWIGGTRPGNARFVPPPHTEVADCMAALERFLNADDDLPVLVRAALAHVQFETIHPFLDGNGRAGRLLIVLTLVARGMLREPLLYLSLYLKRHRAVYYELLGTVRETGDWEAWLGFFLKGVRATATDAVEAARRLVDMFAADRERLRGIRRGGSALRVFDAMTERPIRTIAAIRQATGLSHPTVSASLELLAQSGIAREISGRRRGRLFAYQGYLDILGEGMEDGAGEQRSA